VLRTRQMLREALLALVAEVGYDALTIQDITDRANLRRATFYMHYRDKESLLADALTEITAELTRESAAMLSEGGLSAKLLPGAYAVLFVHVEKYHALYRNILFSQNAVRISHRLQEDIVAMLLPLIESTGKTRIPARVVASYIAAAEMSMLMWWLANDRPYPPQQIAEFVRQLTWEGVSHIVGME